MAIYNLVYTMESGKFGWTYQFWVEIGGESPRDFERTRGVENALLAFNPSNVVMTSQRLRKVDSRLTDVNIINKEGKESGRNAGLINDAVLVKLESDTSYSRLLSVRGVIDDWLDMSRLTGRQQMSPEAFDRAQDLVDEIVDAGVFRLRRLVDEVVNPWTEVNQLKNSDVYPGFTDATVFADVLGNIGDTIYFGRVDRCQLPGLRGSWQILAKSGNTITIAYPWQPHWSLTATIEPNGLRARKQEYSYDNLTSGFPHSASTRDTGRPFALSRGRSRGVSCRR